MKTGVLIINLGTPDDPSPNSVGRYLKQFLMDKWVIDIPVILRWIFVHSLIVPKRKFTSAKAYQKIWNDKGSPLLYYSKSFTDKLQKKLGERFDVQLAMRYGTPSIRSAVEYFKRNNFQSIIVLPLYPQYAESSTRSSIEQLRLVLKKLNYFPKISIVPPFHSSEGYIKAFASLIREKLSDNSHLLLSYHGLPEHHIKRTDLSGDHCLVSATCCDQLNDNNRFCYRAHCFATSRLIAKELGLGSDQYSVSFQSRLGRRPWIKPYTDFHYKDLISSGKNDVVVASPSFVTDCLETLEEIGIRLRSDFLKEGGTSFELVGCLNDNDEWVNSVSDVVVQVSKT